MDVAPSRFDQNWQSYLRPLMSAMLVGLTVFFFAATLFQLVNLNARINASPQLEPSTLLALSACPPAVVGEACLAERRLRMAALLEANALARRHHEADVQLMAAIWSRYLGFSTGMILALVGAAFILGKLSDTGTNLDFQDPASAARATLTTSSPGLVMVVCGVVLMVVNITTLHRFGTVDTAIYFSGDGVLHSGPMPDIYDGETSPPPASAPKQEGRKP
ncbi:MAG TPA: hypothetical protein VFW48_07820 [Solirubrobacterales bacterium]|nr:hypothetical protein [Solirubrobacterales bacterium]